MSPCQAITVYAFFVLLLNSLGGFQAVSKALQRNHATEAFSHFFPFNLCLKPWRFIHVDAGSVSEHEPLFPNSRSNELQIHDRDPAASPTPSPSTTSTSNANAFHFHGARRNPFLRKCTIGVLQYCLVQIVCCCLVFVLSLCGVYGDGEWDFKNAAYPYFVFVLSASQSVAIYCLVLFYHSVQSIRDFNASDAVYSKFERMRALWKFMCIKGVVFFTYWQSVVIDVLVFVGFIHDDMMSSVWSASEIADSLQDFIICIEMLFFAVAHHYAFNPADFGFGDNGGGDTPRDSEESEHLREQESGEEESRCMKPWQICVVRGLLPSLLLRVTG